MSKTVSNVPTRSVEVRRKEIGFGFREDHARVMEGADRFKIAFNGDLHFLKQLSCGGIDFWQPPPRLWRGRYPK